MASSSVQGEGKVYKLRAVLQVKHLNAQCSCFNNTIIIMSNAIQGHSMDVKQVAAVTEPGGALLTASRDKNVR